MTRVALETVPRNYKFDNLRDPPRLLHLAGEHFELRSWFVEAFRNWEVVRGYGLPNGIEASRKVRFEYLARSLRHTIPLNISYDTGTGFAELELLVTVGENVLTLQHYMSVHELNTFNILDAFLREALATRTFDSPYVTKMDTSWQG
jgi:hypothetical protein